MLSEFHGDALEVLRQRVNEARQRQVERFGAKGPQCNAHMGQQEMGACCELDKACQTLMRSAYEKMGLTARSYDRILRVAHGALSGDLQLLRAGPHLGGGTVPAGTGNEREGSPVRRKGRSGEQGLA